MKRLSYVLLMSALAGYLARTLDRPHDVLAKTSASQDQAKGGGRAGPDLPDIPPVPSPPLYPDPDQPKKAMHFSVDDLHKIHEVRQANAARGIQVAPADARPRIEGQNFRTHHFGVSSSGYGITFRQKFETPRPAVATGVMSQYDDADQHEGVTDFFVVVGGSGQFVVDGEIENREYGRDPHTPGSGLPARNTGNVRFLLPGEFHGQPIKGGHTYDAKAGDWLVIPPGVPHWWLPTPREGMSYLLLKVNIGLYPPAIID